MIKISIESIRADQKLSAEETAEVFGVVSATVRRYAREGKIRAFKVGNLYKFLGSDVLQFIESNAVTKEVE